MEMRIGLRPFAEKGDSGGRIKGVDGDLFIFPGRRHRGKDLTWSGNGPLFKNLSINWGRERSKIIKSGRKALRPSGFFHRIPAIPKDIGSGELPQEGRLEDGAVSFSKGCYLGQEVMSRLHSMGQVKRHLVLVKADRELPYGATIRSGSKKVGLVKSRDQLSGSLPCLGLDQPVGGSRCRLAGGHGRRPRAPIKN